MEKKWWILVGVIAIGVSILLSFMPTSSIRESDWIQSHPDGFKDIQVEKITDGAGSVDDNGQQYITDTIGTVFGYEGWYKGQYFKREFYQGSQLVKKIAPGMNPQNDIIEGFIVENIEEGIPIVFIFLDQDWRNEVNHTKIFWGKSYQNKKDFNFSNEISNGVYLDIIQDDTERFENSFALHSGGIMVGDITLDETGTLISFS